MLKIEDLFVIYKSQIIVVHFEISSKSRVYSIYFGFSYKKYLISRKYNIGEKIDLKSIKDIDEITRGFWSKK